jgi:capsular exopolysaccharide synthesis family protein
MARSGKTVILVDADLRKPSLQHVFETPGPDGLTSVLWAQKAIDDVIYPVKPSGLSVVFSGSIPPDPSLALRSPLMGNIIAELENRADVLIFDSPPVLAVTDSILLKALVDGTIMVFDAQSTTNSALREATSRLNRAAGPLLGLVINKTRPSGRDNYHESHYFHAPERDPEDSPDAGGVLHRIGRILRRSSGE